MTDADDSDQAAVKDILGRAKALAVEYYGLTHKPLGVTGEVAELEASNLLGLRLETARTPYYDAHRRVGDLVERFQIKGRAVGRNDRYRGRVSAIKCDPEYEYVLLVLLDLASLDAIEIWQADRVAVLARLDAPGSKARNERRSMGITQFKSIARRVWPLEPMPERHTRVRSNVAASSTPQHRGPIGALVSELLMDASLDYAQIVHRVKLDFPQANTSTKSVASTARDLRRLGLEIPRRD